MVRSRPAWLSVGLQLRRPLRPLPSNPWPLLFDSSSTQSRVPRHGGGRKHRCLGRMAKGISGTQAHSARAAAGDLVSAALDSADVVVSVWGSSRTSSRGARTGGAIRESAEAIAVATAEATAARGVDLVRRPCAGYWSGGPQCRSDCHFRRGPSSWRRQPHRIVGPFAFGEQQSGSRHHNCVARVR